MALAPLVGLVPGAAAAAVAWLATRAGAGALLAAALAIAALALATRGLHLDGLADTADGFSAGYDRDRVLEVMRRGDTGPAGAAALVLVLLVQVAALAQALAGFGALAVLVAAVAGRAALPAACARGVPAARPEGLGSLVAGAVPRLGLATSLALTLAVVTGALVGAGQDLPAALLTGAGLVALAVAVAAIVVLRAVRRLGGVTGDVLGACVELATLAALVLLACR